MSRDRGKFYVFAQLSRYISSEIQAENRPISQEIGITMANTRKNSVYVDYVSFTWRLPLIQLSRYFFDAVHTLPFYPPRLSFPIEVKPSMSCNISLSDPAKLGDMFKGLCTVNDKDHLPKLLKWFSGKQLPFFMRRFVCLYVTTQSGEVIKAKLHRNIKEYFLKMPLGMPLSDSAK
jgi:hypothetical protein